MAYLKFVKAVVTQQYGWLQRVIKNSLSWKRMLLSKLQSAVNAASLLT